MSLFCINLGLYAQIPTQGLLVYIPFAYGFSGDSSSLQLPITSYYVIGGPDRFGQANQAIHFFGASSDVQINISNHLPVFQLQEFTVSIWFSAISDQLTPTPVLVKRKNIDGIPILSLDLSRTAMRVMTNSNEAEISCTTPPPSFDQWTMLTMVCTHDSVFLYANALKQSSIARTDTISYREQLNYISIGSNGGGNSQVFSGFIDDFLMYNRSLSPTEIEQLYTDRSSVGIDKNHLSSFSYHWNNESQTLTIQSDKKIKSIQLYNLWGQKMTETYHSYILDLSYIPSQLYLIQVEEENGQKYFQRFLKP